MTDDRPSAPLPRPRLTRSSDDRVVAGVAGGLGRHLGVDPLAVRITFVILTFAGGLGLLAYLAFLVLLPSDDPDAPPVGWGAARTIGAGLLVVAALAILIPDWLWGPELPVLFVVGLVAFALLRAIRDDGAGGVGRTAAKAGLGILLLGLAAGGFVAAAAGSAVGGGIVVAGLVIAFGVGLVGGAFNGGARWLIAPGLLLALPLGAVAATDLDVRGSWGERTFRPLAIADLAGGYEMGVGSMRVDLRGLDLPAGRSDLSLDMGLGEIQVLVPDGMCVTTEAHAGMGAIDTGDGEEGGVDIDVRDVPRVASEEPRLHLVAGVGVGAIHVGDRWTSWDGPHRSRRGGAEAWRASDSCGDGA